MDIEKENDFLKNTEIDFIRQQLLIKPVHRELLDKIDPDNTSRAARIVFDDHIRYTKLIGFEKYLITFCFGILLIGVGMLPSNIYVSLTSIFTGVFMIGFSIYMYSYGRKRYEKGVK